ncbi:MAG: DNRLRE domain-containing protein [Candidatus Sungbacteria bacterium]|nr:DNRLRE domain-containing protein [Candidatus Sungbacteria bacterium]
MIYHTKQLFFLGVLLLVANAFLPNPIGGEFANGLQAAQSEQVTVTYQLGDGKGSVSETDDGTISTRYLEDSNVRSGEYEGQGDSSELNLKFLKETSGSETTLSVKRFLIGFPNIIGGGASQIPSDATLVSAKLKLTLSVISGPENMRVNAYRVLQRWQETESGYLRAPSWRQYQRSVTEGENRWENHGVDVPKSSESVPISAEVAIPRTPEDLLVIDVASAVKAWMGGEPNYGLMLRFFEETIGSSFRLASFYGSESQVADSRPELEIVYMPKAVPPPPEPEPCREVFMPVCPEGFASGPTGVYDGDARCVIGYDFRCNEATEPPVSAPAPVVLPPAPVPVPKPTVIPAPKPTSSLVPEPSSEQVPAPSSSGTPEELVQKPQPATSTSSVKTEEIRPGEALNRIFKFIQKNILETWDRVIKLFKY